MEYDNGNPFNDPDFAGIRVREHVAKTSPIDMQVTTNYVTQVEQVDQGARRGFHAAAATATAPMGVHGGEPPMGPRLGLCGLAGINPEHIVVPGRAALLWIRVIVIPMKDRFALRKEGSDANASDPPPKADQEAAAQQLNQFLTWARENANYVANRFFLDVFECCFVSATLKYFAWCAVIVRSGGSWRTIRYRFDATIQQAQAKLPAQLFNTVVPVPLAVTIVVVLMILMLSCPKPVRRSSNFSERKRVSVKRAYVDESDLNRFDSRDENNNNLNLNSTSVNEDNISKGYNSLFTLWSCERDIGVMNWFQCSTYFKPIQPSQEFPLDVTFVDTKAVLFYKDHITSFMELMQHIS